MSFGRVFLGLRSSLFGSFEGGRRRDVGPHAVGGGSSGIWIEFFAGDDIVRKRAGGAVVTGEGGISEVGIGRRRAGGAVIDGGLLDLDGSREAESVGKELHVKNFLLIITSAIRLFLKQIF